MASDARFFILKLFLLNSFFHVSLESNSGPKIDTPSFDHILKTGENFNVLCEGNGTLEWDLPDVAEDEDSKYTKIETEAVAPRNERYTNATEMRITNISFPYVGIYYCINREDSTSAPSMIYLYVHDEVHLATTDTIYAEDIITTQDSSVSLPCIPTAPDVEVTLVKETDDGMIPISLDSEFYGYSQFAGISTDDTEQVQLTNYICYFRRGNYSIYYQIAVEVEPKTHSILKPSLSEMSHNKRNIIGETIILRCEVKSHVRVDTSWEIPKYDEEDVEERMETSDVENDPENPDYLYSTLTIRNTSLSDSGQYKCEVKDYQGHVNEAIINITVYDHLYIRLNQEGCIVRKKEGVQNTKCSVQINAHPLPNVTWWKDETELIPQGTLQNYRKINSTNMDAWLEIKNVTLSDIGKYTFIAENEYDTATLSYFVDLIEKPVIELKVGNEYQLEEEQSVVECIVSAYPEPLIVLMFKPCLDGGCDYEAIENIQFHRDNHEFIASVKNIFSTSGVIKCAAFENVEGDDADEQFEKEIGLYISDIEGGFKTEAQDNTASNDLYHTVTVTIEDSIELKCSAYIQNFTQKIKWKRHSKEIISNMKYVVVTSSTQFSDSCYLNITNLNINDQGFYTCELYKITDEKEELIKSQDITLSMSQYISTVLFRSNFNSTMEIKDGEKFELICDFRGTPKPIVTWYKNNETFTSSERRSISTDGKRVTFTYIVPEDEGVYRCEGRNFLGMKNKETKLILKSKKWIFVK